MLKSIMLSSIMPNCIIKIKSKIRKKKKEEPENQQTPPPLPPPLAGIPARRHPVAAFAELYPRPAGVTDEKSWLKYDLNTSELGYQ